MSWPPKKKSSFGHDFNFHAIFFFIYICIYDYIYINSKIPPKKTLKKKIAFQNAFKSNDTQVLPQSLINSPSQTYTYLSWIVREKQTHDRSTNQPLPPLDATHLPTPS